VELLRLETLVHLYDAIRPTAIGVAFLVLENDEKYIR
jgi:hypothetical protein